MGRGISKDICSATGICFTDVQKEHQIFLLRLFSLSYLMQAAETRTVEISQSL